jgi:hypothetical protein
MHARAANTHHALKQQQLSRSVQIKMAMFAERQTKPKNVLRCDLQKFLQRYALFCKNITSDHFQAAEVAGARVHAKFPSH